MFKYLWCGIILMMMCSSALKGQNTKSLNGKSPPASLKDVSWIAGHWKGKAFGGITEEVWTPPLGDSMMGSFKLVKDGKVDFYELCTIREMDGTIILQLKHFHGDLKGWEEKNETVDFPLVEVGNDVVYFDDFTFKKISDNEMHLYVVISMGSQEEEMLFKYYREN